MALQLVEQEIRGDIVGVPAVPRLTVLVAAVRILLAQQSVVLDVVGAGQLPPGEEIVNCEEGQHDPAEGGDQGDLQHGAQGVGLQHFVFRMPDGLAEARQALLLDLPATAESAGNLAQGELVDVFAHARTGRVGRRRDVAMVTAVVFDAEMAIGRDGEDDACQPAFERRFLVTQFVCRVDAEATVEPGGQRQDQDREQRQRLRADEGRDGDEDDGMQGHGQHRQPAVVGIILKLADQFLRRIVAILAQPPVEQAGPAVDADQRREQSPFAACGHVEADAAQGQQGIE